MIEKANTDLYQVMPPLSEEEYASLKEDIEEHGVMVAVEIDEAGNILDGYHRVKACKELGITDFPTVVREGWTEEEKYEHALRLNVRRRHLSGDQLKEVIRDFKEKHPDVSDRQVAKAVGVSPLTVGSVIEEFAGVQNGQVQNVQGADGKSYPSSEKQAEKQRQDIRDAIKCHPDMNNHQIAGALGVSDHTVQKQREQIEGESDVDKANNHIGDDELYDEPEQMEDTYVAPHKMTALEDLKMAFNDHVHGFDMVLNDLLCNYENDEEKGEMLFSEKGIEASLAGLSELLKVVEKYETLVRSREYKL